jgi:hypothetical protein
MISVQFKNKELLDLYSILIKFSDRLENQDVLEIVHTTLLDVLAQVCPEKEDNQIDNESCLEKVQKFKKWFDQQQIKIDELKTQETVKSTCDCECDHCCNKQKFIDDLNTKYIDSKVEAVALQTMKVPGFKDALENCINDPSTVQKAQVLKDEYPLYTIAKAKFVGESDKDILEDK